MHLSPLLSLLAVASVATLGCQSKSSATEPVDAGCPAGEARCDLPDAGAEEPSDPFLYDDDFENEVAGESPSHWIEDNDADAWRIQESEGGLSYHHIAGAGSAESWLHVFERDVLFETRMKFSDFNASNAKLRVAIRFNHQLALVYAGYDFNTSRWHIKDRDGADSDWVTRAESEVETLEAERWYTLRVVAEGKTVALYIDDMETPKLIADDIVHTSPGRVALSAPGTDADFDNVHLELLSQQGRV